MGGVALALRYTLRILAAISVWFFFGSLLVCAFLISVGYLYHYDAIKLQEFREKAHTVDLQLRTLKVCSDMMKHPERWQGTGLRPPCDGVDDDEISDYEDSSESWSRLISVREAEWRERESGHFGFLAKKLHDSFETPFDALPERLVSYLKWSLGIVMLLAFVVSATESRSDRKVN
jgi:hypothetical protein